MFQEMRTFCDCCGRMVITTLVENTKIALCSECTKEYQREKLLFPKKTVYNFVSDKSVVR